MPRSSPREAKDERSGPHLFKNVVNPFCGTLADDLDVERTEAGLKVVTNGCSQSVAGFERKLPPANPTVNGKEVDLSTAIKEAANAVNAEESRIRKCVVNGKTLYSNVECAAGAPGSREVDTRSSHGFEAPKVLEPPAEKPATVTEKMLDKL